MYSVPFEHDTEIVQGSKLHHPLLLCCLEGVRGTPELWVARQRKGSSNVAL